jgi:hypothetical protein
MTTFTAPGTVMALTLCNALSFAHLGGESTDAVAAATHKAIHQFEARVAETPRDYLSYTILGQLQGRLARETGNLDAYRRAGVPRRASRQRQPPAGDAWPRCDAGVTASVCRGNRAGAPRAPDGA